MPGVTAKKQVERAFEYIEPPADLVPRSIGALSNRLNIETRDEQIRSQTVRSPTALTRLADRMYVLQLPVHDTGSD